MRWHSLLYASFYFLGAAYMLGSARDPSPDVLAQLDEDGRLEEGPVSNIIAEFYTAHAAGNYRRVWALFDVDLKQPFDIADDQVLKFLPEQLPGEPKVLRVDCLVPPEGLVQRRWLLETIVRFGKEAEHSYAVWYFVRRGDTLYLRTVPFLNGPGRRLVEP